MWDKNPLNKYIGGWYFISINVLNPPKCTVTPFFFSDKSLPLLVLCILSKDRKILNVKSFNFISISTQIRSSFSTNAGIPSIDNLQLSFCEAHFTWRNDITCKAVLNRPICDEINKLAWRVLHVTYFIPCSKKADFALRKVSKTQHFQYALSPKWARWSP